VWLNLELTEHHKARVISAKSILVLITMEEGFVEVRDHNIHFIRWGSAGSKILLIHSMGMDAHSMDMLADNLKEEYQILSLTILGHGDSSVPEDHISLPEHAGIIRQCYTQMDFTPNLLIGHSVGGMMGMILTAEHPEEHHGLILVDIAPFESSGSSRPAPPDYFSTETAAREWIRERYPGFTDYYINNRLEYAFLEKDSGYYLKPRGDSIRAGLRIDLWPYVKRMRVPTLLMIGENSDLVTKKKKKEMERIIPDLVVEVVKDTGHMIPQDKPEKFEKLVRDFLNKLDL
jgi:pimeloyl-ACP methyl ester carboxylesterase